MSAAEQLSENVEEYLETIFRLTHRASDAAAASQRGRRTPARGPVAKTGEIAAELGLSPPSVTEMTKRLKERGYVEYEPYRGVRLTAKGREHAYALLRRHRVVQAFLEQVLGMAKEEAHEWGCKMEHVVPAELERYLYSKLPDKDLKGMRPPRTPEETGVEVREAPAEPHPRRVKDPFTQRQGPSRKTPPHGPS